MKFWQLLSRIVNRTSGPASILPDKSLTPEQRQLAAQLVADMAEMRQRAADEERKHLAEWREDLYYRQQLDG